MHKNIVILSDTHGFIHPSIVDLVAHSDIAIHAGDVCEEATLVDLKPLETLIVVAGNNDVHISHLKKTASLSLFSEQIAVEHGHLHGMIEPSHRSLRKAHPYAKIIIYGHTHRRVIDKSDTPWVVNPGAAGRVRTNGGASCLLLKASTQQSWKIEPLCFAD